jgi:hypothetical protein
MTPTATTSKMRPAPEDSAIAATFTACAKPRGTRLEANVSTPATADPATCNVA